VAIDIHGDSLFPQHLFRGACSFVAIDLDPMATTIFSWVYLFRHKPLVRGINLWQQLSKRGEKLLQYTLFGGDR
jgi:hypothetical protein